MDRLWVLYSSQLYAYYQRSFPDPPLIRRMVREAKRASRTPKLISHHGTFQLPVLWYATYRRSQTVDHHDAHATQGSVQLPACVQHRRRVSLPSHQSRQPVRAIEASVVRLLHCSSVPSIFDVTSRQDICGESVVQAPSRYLLTISHATRLRYLAECVFSGSVDSLPDLSLLC